MEYDEIKKIVTPPMISNMDLSNLPQHILPGKITYVEIEHSRFYWFIKKWKYKIGFAIGYYRS